MTKKLKTKLTRTEVEKLLEVFNTIDSMVDDTMEMMDVRLSQLSDVRDKAHSLQQMFNFRPQLGEDGNPKHWLPKVMPDNENAWYYEGDS
tara:strand:+ start:1423 stop:1692 length:270 start_codon:yes stop_codon:yes gene_type:complete